MGLKIKKIISVRKAKIDDCKDLYNWRNNHETLKMFLNTTKVEWNKHVKWFQDSLLNKNFLILLCYLTKSKQKCGVVRFLIDNSETDISINLAPKMRGLGLSKICLKEAIKFYYKSFSQNEEIIARIKKINLKSLRCFESVGFEFKDEINGICNLKLKKDSLKR